MHNSGIFISSLIFETFYIYLIKQYDVEDLRFGEYYLAIIQLISFKRKEFINSTKNIFSKS